MKHKIILILTGIFLVFSLLSGACSQTKSTNAVTSSQKPFSTTASTQTSSSALSTSTVQSNWWDKLGEPEYGGTIYLRATVLSSGVDLKIFSAEHSWFWWWEQLFMNNQTVDPAVFTFGPGYTPDEYFQGQLAKSWEMTDPVTLTVHLREGLHYINNAPANGREFTAEDIQYHYDRMLGTGSGFTTPNVQYLAFFSGLKNATAVDKYTVVFTFKQPSALNFNSLTSLGNQIECRESVEAGGGTITDWKTISGTGPYYLSDFVSGSSFAYTKNPDYWGYDNRYPDNRLPYADSIKAIMIPDTATALASVRTGKIDLLTSLDWRQAQTLAQTNPDLKQASFSGAGHSLEMRYDEAPFNDIKVRTAMQLAMNLPEIAKTHYGGSIEAQPNGHVSQYWQGWCYPYSNWSQELKNEYSYNTSKAMQLLTEAGYPDGFKTVCSAPTNTDIELIEIMKSYLMDIGVDMEIQTMEYLTFQAQGRAGNLHGMMMHTFTNSGSYGPVTMDFVTGGTRNMMRVSDPELDRLNKEFYAATGFSQLPAIIQQYDKLVIEKHVRVQTFNINSYLVYQPYLKGYNNEYALNAFYIPGTPLARMWVDQDLKKSMGR